MNWSEWSIDEVEQVDVKLRLDRIARSVIARRGSARVKVGEEGGAVHRLGEVVALDEIAAALAQEVELGARFDAFGNRLQPDAVAHLDRRGDNGAHGQSSLSISSTKDLSIFTTSNE